MQDIRNSEKLKSIYKLDELFQEIEKEFFYNEEEMKFFKENTVDYDINVMGYCNHGKSILISIDLIDKKGYSICEFHIEEPEHIFDFRSDYFCHQ